jgi:hypothetical protein
MVRDELCLRSDPSPGGEALLEPVMVRGEVVRPAESLEAVRARFEADRMALPRQCRANRSGTPYPVIISEALGVLEAETEKAVRTKELR